MRVVALVVMAVLSVIGSADAADNSEREWGPAIDAYLAGKSRVVQEPTSAVNLMRPAGRFVFCISGQARNLKASDAGIQDDGRSREVRWWNTSLDACEQHLPEARQLALELYKGDAVRANAYLDGVLASSRLIVFDHLPR